MKTPDVRRWTGASALAVAVFLANESITTLTAGARPGTTKSGAPTTPTAAKA